MLNNGLVRCLLFRSPTKLWPSQTVSSLGGLTHHLSGQTVTLLGLLSRIGQDRFIFTGSPPSIVKVRLSLYWVSNPALLGFAYVSTGEHCLGQTVSILAPLTALFSSNRLSPGSPASVV